MKKCFIIMMSGQAHTLTRSVEVARILRPTGKTLFAHWDWDTQVYNTEYKESIRKFVAAFSDWKQGWMDASDGQMGRRLWGCSKAAVCLWAPWNP